MVTATYNGTIDGKDCYDELVGSLEGAEGYETWRADKRLRALNKHNMCNMDFVDPERVIIRIHPKIKEGSTVETIISFPIEQTIESIEGAVERLKSNVGGLVLELEAA